LLPPRSLARATSCTAPMYPKCPTWFYGPSCAETLQSELGRAFVRYSLAFLVLFGCATALLCVQLVRATRASRHLSLWKTIHLLLLLCTISNIITLSIDWAMPPHLMSRLPTLLARGTALATAIGSLVSVYALVLYYYAREAAEQSLAIHIAQSAGSSAPGGDRSRVGALGFSMSSLTRLRRYFVTSLVFYWLVEFTCRALYAADIAPVPTFIVHTSVVGLLALTMGFVFLSVGRAQYRRLQHASAVHDHFTRSLHKLHRLAFAITIAVITTAIAALSLIIATRSSGNPESPHLFLAQQCAYRSLQLLLTTTIAFVLRMPPEVEIAQEYQQLP